jgi:general L-amino acid transport system permease protein
MPQEGRARFGTYWTSAPGHLLSRSKVPRPSGLTSDLSLHGIIYSGRIRAWAYQVLLVAAIVWIFYALVQNTQEALQARGISTGFGFLARQAGFAIGESLIPFTSSDSFARAFLAGVLNTLKVAAVSVVFATLLGVLAGIARLSPNWLLRAISTTYIEVFRNTPQLVQIVFWYTLMTLLPGPRQAFQTPGGAFLSNRGLQMPWLADESAAGIIVAAAVIGFIAMLVLVAVPRPIRHRAALMAAAAIGLPVLAWLATGLPTAVSPAEMRGLNFIGGINLSPEFLALTVGLSLYIGAFIAEIVRAGIQSVGRGQIDASDTIGLTMRDRYAYVILPQALRVIVPPATSQYISLIKNSSLGVAIGYPELFSLTNTIITLSGNTLECIAIMMAVYLLISASIGALLNLYNRVIQIKER